MENANRCEFWQQDSLAMGDQKKLATALRRGNLVGTEETTCGSCKNNRIEVEVELLSQHFALLNIQF